MTELHPAFLLPPIAHRGLHNDQRPENSRAAFDAVFKYGYAIELDVQMSKDGEAMVFHDYSLDRLTNSKGPTQLRTAAELSATLLSNGEGIPTLQEILKQVSGQVGVLVEIKDQDGALGPNVGQLEKRVADILADYHGPTAVMSFNPHSIMAMKTLAPDLPRGLTTTSFPADRWQLIPQKRREELAMIPDYDASDACFISHHFNELDDPTVVKIRNTGDPVLCWTVTSQDEEDTARRLADNITFEGYIA